MLMERNEYKVQMQAHLEAVMGVLMFMGQLKE